MTRTITSLITLILAVLLLVATATSVQAQAPSNPIYATYQYNGHTYQVLSTTGRTHGQALADVAEHAVWGFDPNLNNPYLLHITDIVESTAISVWLNSINTGIKAWLDAEDSQNEGAWLWKDGPAFYERGQYLAYIPWDPGSPGPDYNTADCMTFNTQGRFQDENCSTYFTTLTVTVLEYGQTCLDYQTDGNPNLCPAGYGEKPGFESIVCDNGVQSCSQTTCCELVGFTVTPSVNGAGGSITPNAPQGVAPGATTQFTLTPDAGYEIASVDGTCGGSLTNDTYTTAAIGADCTVVASFATAAPVPALGGFGLLTLAGAMLYAGARRANSRG